MEPAKINKLVLILFMLTLPATLLAACQTATPTGSVTPGMVSFARDIKSIFNAKCVICHQGPEAPGGLSLVSNLAHKNLVNMKSTESPLNRVTPGQPQDSYMLHKLLGTQAQAGGSGARMPFNGISLPQPQMELVRQWIIQGAPDN